MPTVNKITPCLWFDTQGEEAATFYTSIFDNSQIVQVSHYGSSGPRPEGMVMMVGFEAQRAMKAVLGMGKIDLAEIQRAMADV